MAQKIIEITHSCFTIKQSVLINGFGDYPYGFTKWFITKGGGEKFFSARIIETLNNLLTLEKKEYQERVGGKKKPQKELLTLWSSTKKFVPESIKMSNPSSFKKFSEYKKFALDLISLSFEEWKELDKSGFFD